MKRKKKVGKRSGKPLPPAAKPLFDFDGPELSGDRGRPSEYRVEFVELARMACSLGATDREVAERLGVTDRTLRKWRNLYREFADAMAVAKEYADARVVRSLYLRAVGYSFESEQVFCTQGLVTRVPVIEKVAPDPTSIIFWLKNRDPENWRDRRELTGKDGEPLGPVTPILNITLSNAEQPDRPDPAVQAESGVSQ